MSVEYLRGTTPYNSLRFYERYVLNDPILGKHFQDQPQDIDVYDFTILKESYRSFSAIFRSDAICLIWAGSFARILPPETFERADHLTDRHHRQQSCITLVKRSLDLLSEMERPVILSDLLRVCRKVSLFFRGSYERLDFLWVHMPPCVLLNGFQQAPDPSLDEAAPPRSCWSFENTWTPSDWPRSHWGSWDHARTVVAGIGLGRNLGWKVLENGGLVRDRSFFERLWIGDWSGMGLSFRDRQSRSSALEIGCSSLRSLVDQYESRIFLDPKNPNFILNLIRAGIDPFVLVDTSEWAFGRPTQWQEGDESPHYVPLFNLACEFGSREIVEALLEDRESFIQHYQNVNLYDSPYKRAVLNEDDPSVLIPLLEEARLHPEGMLAREIENPGVNAISFDCPFDALNLLARFIPNQRWRFRSEDHLILACFGGSLDLVRYLVERREEMARALLPKDATDAEKCMAAAAAASQFVNQRSAFRGPRGTPAEIAVKRGHFEIVQFLCQKGAEVTVDLQMRAMRQASEQVGVFVEEWREAQEAILEQADVLQLHVTANQEGLNQMTALHVAYQNQLMQLQEIRKGYGGEISRHLGLVERAKALADQLKQLADQLEQLETLKTDAPKRVLERYYPLLALRRGIA